MPVIDGDSQLRQTEDPRLPTVAGAYGVGSGDAFAGEGEQEAAVDAEEGGGFLGADETLRAESSARGVHCFLTSTIWPL